MPTPNEETTFSPSALIQAEKAEWHLSSQAPNVDATNTYPEREEASIGDTAN